VEATDTVVHVVTPDQSKVRRFRDAPAILFSLFFIVLGVLAYQQTAAMSSMGSVFPTTIAGLLILLSALLIALQVGRPAAPAKSGDAAQPAASTWRRVAIIVAMGIWAALLPSIGFFVTSLVAFFVLISIATFERLSMREMVAHAIAAIAIVGSFQVLMDKVLGLRMPNGVFF
jgi:putative tricarboxylic transport membrane protein